MIVDDLWVSIGSANLDNRSFRTNAEANLNILDGAFAGEQAQIFEQDLKQSTRITYQQWQRRPAWQKIGDKMNSWFAWLM
jgi:cardiolipin synthase